MHLVVANITLWATMYGQSFLVSFRSIKCVLSMPQLDDLNHSFRFGGFPFAFLVFWILEDVEFKFDASQGVQATHIFLDTSS